MPKIFGQKLSAGAIKKIVDYLSQVKAGSPPPKISMILAISSILSSKRSSPMKALMSVAALIGAAGILLLAE